MKIEIEAARRLSKIQAGRETGRGAGALMYCPDTNRFLLLKRSENCDEPHTWCSGGGGVEPGEALHEAVRREYEEETGFDQNESCDLHYLGMQTHPGFEFHNYLGLVDNEFEPQLNDEHTDSQWLHWKDFPVDEMHPHMWRAFTSDEGQALIRKHTNAYTEVAKIDKWLANLKARRQG